MLSLYTLFLTIGALTYTPSPRDSLPLTERLRKRRYLGTSFSPTQQGAVSHPGRWAYPVTPAARRGAEMISSQPCQLGRAAQPQQTLGMSA